MGFTYKNTKTKEFSYSPEPRLTDRVLIIEECDYGQDVEEVIEVTRDEGAVSEDDNGEIFWIVFANEPRQVWDFTEKSLRRHFAKKPVKKEEVS